MTNEEQIKAMDSKHFARWIKRLLFARAGECLSCPAWRWCKENWNDEMDCEDVIAMWLAREATRKNTLEADSANAQMRCNTLEQDEVDLLIRECYEHCPAEYKKWHPWEDFHAKMRLSVEYWKEREKEADA